MLRLTAVHGRHGWRFHDPAARDRAAVLVFTEVMADRDMHGKYSLELYDTGRYMRLDAAAQRALNVLKSKTDANDNFSLYGLLNRARTAMGKRLLKVQPRAWHVCCSKPSVLPSRGTV